MWASSLNLPQSVGKPQRCGFLPQVLVTDAMGCCCHHVAGAVVSLWCVLRLHALCVNLVAQLWRSVEADVQLLPNCLFGLYSANFLIGNADLWIPGSTRLHNTICHSLVSYHISCLLRVHMTPYYILCIYTVPIVRMDWYCSTR